MRRYVMSLHESEERSWSTDSHRAIVGELSLKLHKCLGDGSETMCCILKHSPIALSPAPKTVDLLL